MSSERSSTGEAASHAAPPRSSTAMPRARPARIRRYVAGRIFAVDGRNPQRAPPLRAARRPAPREPAHARPLRDRRRARRRHRRAQPRVAQPRPVARRRRGAATAEAALHHRAAVERQHPADGRRRETCGLPWDAILGAEVVRAYKPSPQVYSDTVDILGVEPAELSSPRTTAISRPRAGRGCRPRSCCDRPSTAARRPT